MDALNAISTEAIRDLILFLSPFDLGGKREESPSVTSAQWLKLQDHCEPVESDSPMIFSLKTRVREELVRMDAVHQIELCKKLVAFFKQTSSIMDKLPTSLKQEVATRWNSHLTLLKSIDGKLGDVSKNITYMAIIIIYKNKKF